MTPWWLVMLGGLLGSAHCVGMCGGFAAIVGLRTGSLLGNLRAQFLYSAGRLMTYGTLGAIAGFAGRRITDNLPQIMNVPAALCLVAGAFLIREGLLASGVLRQAATRNPNAGCLLTPLFSTILRTPGARNTFLAGMATGVLPCGLVYAFLSLAASTSDLMHGMVTMLAFGAGTIPLMVVTGCGASLLSLSARQRLWKAAAWSVVLTGLLTVCRGWSFLRYPSDSSPVKCPFCSQKCDVTEGTGNPGLETTSGVSLPMTSDQQPAGNPL